MDIKRDCNVTKIKMFHFMWILLASSNANLIAYNLINMSQITFFFINFCIYFRINSFRINPPKIFFEYINILYIRSLKNL